MSIIAFGLGIVTISAPSRELATIVSRMREYDCRWRDYSYDEREIA